MLNIYSGTVLCIKKVTTQSYKSKANNNNIKHLLGSCYSLGTVLST